MFFSHHWNSLILSTQVYVVVHHGVWFSLLRSPREIVVGVLPIQYNGLRWVHIIRAETLDVGTECLDEQKLPKEKSIVVENDGDKDALPPRPNRGSLGHVVCWE